MKYSGHRKLLCELSKLSKFNAFNLLGYLTNTDASIIVYKFPPKRTGFNMYTEYTQPQLTFLALHSCFHHSPKLGIYFILVEMSANLVSFKTRSINNQFVLRLSGLKQPPPLSPIILVVNLDQNQHKIKIVKTTHRDSKLRKHKL